MLSLFALVAHVYSQRSAAPCAKPHMEASVSIRAAFLHNIS